MAAGVGFFGGARAGGILILGSSGDGGRLWHRCTREGGGGRGVGRVGFLRRAIGNSEPKAGENDFRLYSIQ